ncbi:MAG: amidohydrolase family protein [Balneola sp.]|nr:amidohydrolase family protein [Balneola sp.]MBO6649774.1 amidohydrolase family protein [Balneola sp.]MBO6712337.1 amidohydrolase family protein [Balneola sp.]MBO6800531.1 amidohydrolase family protein [Balneola sp.]MBO6871485.1 amidohydrolase family protein [Balneola sp.]
MTRFSSFLILFFAVTFTYSVSAQDNIRIIHAGSLLAIPGEKPLSNQTVVIKNGSIESVHSGFKSSSELGFDDAEVTDLKDKFVMPGFIDMHTHLTGERDPDANPHEWTTMNEQDLAFKSLPYLERTLHAGFTTVRNLGADAELIGAIQRATAKGLIAGPRIIYSAGAISATGGHGDSHGYRTEILELDENVGICNGADDCRRAVRARVKQGAGVIKITATGGVLSNTAAGLSQQLTDEEMKSIVDAANSLGRKVAAHAHAADGINAALRAGVSSIDHGSYLDDESVKLFLENDAWLVPTLLAGISVRDELVVNDQIPPAIVDKINTVVPVVEASFKRALKGGVNIAFGTDSGVSKHGENAREFEIMVDYGMSESHAIKTATLNAAELLGMKDQIGSIEEGKSADIIAVDKNPLDDISELKNVTFVMKSGVIYKMK